VALSKFFGLSDRSACCVYKLLNWCLMMMHANHEHGLRSGTAIGTGSKMGQVVRFPGAFFECEIIEPQ
jgi:hypothetical protein